MIARTGGIGIAIENNCAIEFIDGRFYKVIASKNYARAYRVYKKWRQGGGRTNTPAGKTRAYRVSQPASVEVMESEELEILAYSMVEPSCW